MLCIYNTNSTLLITVLLHQKTCNQGVQQTCFSKETSVVLGYPTSTKSWAALLHFGVRGPKSSPEDSVVAHCTITTECGLKDCTRSETRPCIFLQFSLIDPDRSGSICCNTSRSGSRIMTGPPCRNESNRNLANGCRKMS